MRNFGRSYRELRLANHYTQRELAKLLNVSFTYLSKIENGALDYPPSIDFLIGSAGLFDCDPVWLIGQAGQIDTAALMERCKHEPKVAELLFLMARGALPTADIEQIIAGYDIDDWGIWEEGVWGVLRKPYSHTDPIDMARSMYGPDGKYQALDAARGEGMVGE